MIYKKSIIVLIYFIAVISFSCISKQDSIKNLTSKSFTKLSLKTIFEFTESDNVAFETISSIKTDHHGNILVRDFRQPFLFMFDREGNFLQKIGNEGKGPGEFQQILSFTIDRDSLWVLGAYSTKIEQFEFKNDKYIHIRSISLESERLTGGFLRKLKNGFLIRNQFVISSNSPNNPTVQPISLINEKGEILIDTLFTLPIAEQMTLTGSGYTWKSNKIFGNKSLMAFDGKGHIYTLWTDSLVVDTYNIEGDRKRAYSYAIEPVKVTEDERDSLLNKYDRFRADLRRKLPDVKPLVKDFLIDDQQRIWVELLTRELGHGWFCFTKKGEPLFKINIPKPGAELHEVSGNRLFWSYQNDFGAPTLGVSRIDN